MVGHWPYSLMPSRISGSASTLTCWYSTPVAPSAATALAEKPHCGARGSPFMNRTTWWSLSRVWMRVCRAGSSGMAVVRGAGEAGSVTSAPGQWHDAGHGEPRPAPRPTPPPRLGRGAGAVATGGGRAVVAPGLAGRAAGDAGHPRGVPVGRAGGRLGPAQSGTEAFADQRAGGLVDDRRRPVGTDAGRARPARRARREGDVLRGR